MARSRPVLLTAALSAAAVLGYLSYRGLAGHGESPAEEVDAEALSAVATLPDFSLTNLAGEQQSIQSWPGKPLLINFWATWCGPCRQEMPHLNKLYEKYKSSGFVLLGVNVDDDTAQAAGVASKLGVKFPVLPDSDKRVSRQYDLSAMPSTVLIDRDGRVRYLHRGYQNGYENTYDKQIRELLKE
jgi:peroxiredoxin